MRVADIQACYEEWKSKGAEFVTPPIDREAEIRCYLRDPDGSDLLTALRMSDGHRAWQVTIPVPVAAPLSAAPGGILVYTAPVQNGC